MHVGVGRTDGKLGGEYIAILYRSDRFTVRDNGTFWLSPTPDEPGSMGWGNTVPRICTWAHFEERQTGRTLYVFNTHLDHESQPARMKGVELIAEHIASRPRPDPVILMGDFNAGEDNPVIEFVKNGPSPSPRLADTFRVLHPDARDVGTFNAWVGRTSGPKIDFVFAAAPPDTEVLAAAIVRTKHDGRYLSDHFPVTARIRIRARHDNP